MVRVYIDICCLNRPFDDQQQDRILLEAEAVLLVLDRVERGDLLLISSDVLALENSKNKDDERRRWIRRVLSSAAHHVRLGRLQRERGRQLFRIGFGAYDSLHLACAESAKADVLLTTDDRFLAQARKHAASLFTTVRNPVEW